MLLQFVLGLLGAQQNHFRIIIICVYLQIYEFVAGIDTKIIVMLQELVPIYIRTIKI